MSQGRAQIQWPCCSGEDDFVGEYQSLNSHWALQTLPASWSCSTCTRAYEPSGVTAAVNPLPGLLSRRDSNKSPGATASARGMHSLRSPAIPLVCDDWRTTFPLPWSNLTLRERAGRQNISFCILFSTHWLSSSWVSSTVVGHRLSKIHGTWPPACRNPCPEDKLSPHLPDITQAIQAMIGSGFHVARLCISII